MRILNGYRIRNYWGENFGEYFWMLIGFFILGYILCIFVWAIHAEDERSLKTQKASKDLQDRAGQTYTVEVWPIEWRASLKSRAGFLILIVGNLLGLVAIIAYAWFIFYGFVRKW